MIGKRRFRFSVGGLLLAIALLAGVLALARLSAKMHENEWARERRSVEILPPTHNIPITVRVRPFCHQLLLLFTRDECFERVIQYDGIGLGAGDVEFVVLPDLSELRTLYIRDNPVTDRTMRRIARLEHLEFLDVSSTFISNTGIEALARGNGDRLHSLFIASTDVTNSGLTTISQFRRLEELGCSFNDVDDTGVECFVELENLRRLRLAYTNVTDRSLRTLEQLKKLEFVDLEGTKVTKNGIAAFSKNRPDVVVDAGLGGR